MSNEVIVDNFSTVIITPDHGEPKTTVSTPENRENTDVHDSIVVDISIESTESNSEIETGMIENVHQIEETPTDINSVTNEISH